MNELINWADIEHNGNKSGQKKTLCPKCSHNRKKKTDKCLSVNFTKGLAFCFNCEAVSFRDDEKTIVQNNYTLPEQTWRNYTNLSDGLVKWFKEVRGISQHTLIDCGITEEVYYQPALGKKVKNIVFNYFEGDTVVNKKYRSREKHFTQSTNGKSIFYGINDIVGKKEIYIVEGEADKLAFWEHGIKNVVSVPNGANNNDNYWINCEKYLDEVDHIIIAVDMDEKGEALKESISHRLGKHRCSYIDFDGKDANDDLISGKLKDSILNVKRFPVSGTFTFSDVKSKVLDLYDNGLPKTLYPKNPCFGNLKNIFSVMFGQLTISTGIRSHGKSTMTDWYVLNLINDHNLKGSWFSPEHGSLDLYNVNFLQKVIGKNFWGKYNGQKVPRITKDEINQYERWSNQKIYFTDPKQGEVPTWDWLLTKFKEQIYSFGINIFVIDAFNKVLLGSGNKKDEIDQVLTKLTSFCQQYNVCVFLVAHPTKIGLQDNGIKRIPSLTDVSGSGDFENQTHNGFTIYRYWEDMNTGQEAETVFINMKTKFSFQGKMTEEVAFKYYGPNERYYANGIEPTFNMINHDKIEDENKIPMMQPSQAFDDEFNDPDQLPF